MPKKVVDGLQECITALGEAMKHAVRGVAWSERVAHERLKKVRNLEEETSPEKRKVDNLCCATPEKKRPKRHALW